MLVTVINETRFIDSMCKTLRGVIPEGEGPWGGKCAVSEAKQLPFAG